ncbi:hypothetical protein PC123_g41 [Phytophthora cactorum]|nr:hypothetical protein PC123_g41 [Phytophthora cactorum]
MDRSQFPGTMELGQPLGIPPVGFHRIAWALWNT